MSLLDEYSRRANQRIGGVPGMTITRQSAIGRVINTNFQTTYQEAVNYEHTMMGVGSSAIGTGLAIVKTNPIGGGLLILGGSLLLNEVKKDWQTAQYALHPSYR